MPSNPGTIGLDLLNAAPYGAYAVNSAQTILLWNHAAESILGHHAQDVIGRPCYEVLQNIAETSDTPICQNGCPSLQAIRKGGIPHVYEIRMLDSSGHRKLVTVTPMIIAATEYAATIMIHLFHESKDNDRSQSVAGKVDRFPSTTPNQLAAGTPGGADKVTSRELQVLRLTASGLMPREIAHELNISYHTVRNNIASVRRKLGAPTKLHMVRNARFIGLL